MSHPQHGLHVVHEMDEVRSPGFAGAGGGEDMANKDLLGGGLAQKMTAQNDEGKPAGVDLGNLMGLIKKTEEVKVS